MNFSQPTALKSFRVLRDLLYACQQQSPLHCQSQDYRHGRRLIRWGLPRLFQQKSIPHTAPEGKEFYSPAHLVPNSGNQDESQHRSKTHESIILKWDSLLYQTNQPVTKTTASGDGQSDKLKKKKEKTTKNNHWTDSRKPPSWPLRANRYGPEAWLEDGHCLNAELQVFQGRCR